jgi:hypothetical protein
MMNKILLTLAASALAFTAGLSSVAAQEGPATGVLGEPQCHGEGVSFGSSAFGVAPKDRAEELDERTGEEVTVREFQERSQTSCAASASVDPGQ